MHTSRLYYNRKESQINLCTMTLPLDIFDDDLFPCLDVFFYRRHLLTTIIPMAHNVQGIGHPRHRRPQSTTPH